MTGNGIDLWGEERRKGIMGKRIGLVCGVSRSYKLMLSLGRELEERYGVMPFYLYFQSGVGEYLKKRGITEDKMLNLHKDLFYGKWKTAHVDMEYLRRVESLYGIPNLWVMWETIRTHQNGHTLYNALKLFEETFRVYEDFAEKNSFDAFITHVYPGTIPSYALSNVFGRRNVPVYTVFPHRMAGRFVMYTGCKDEYQKINRIFTKLLNRTLTEDERSLAEGFLAQFRQRRYLSSQEKLVINKKEFALGRLLRVLEELYRTYRYRSYRTFRHSNPLGPLIYVKNRLYSLCNRRVLYLSSLFSERITEEKFVLYFLHKQPETSTLAKAPFHLDQVSLVQNISKSLPIDYRLYVKPHHNDFGNQSLDYYRRLSQRPNIRLLSVRANSHALIRDCAMVITITGSVGWEGILFEKPVLTFGNVFYNSFPLVQQVEDIRRLPEIIRGTLQSFKPDHELLLKYIVAHHQGSYEGTPIAPALDEKTSLNPKNIAKVAKGIAEELGLTAVAR